MPKATLQPTWLVKIIRLRFLLLAFSLILLVLPWLIRTEGTGSDWTYFLGRFHPLIIHFPIVLLVLLLILELLNAKAIVTLSSPLRWILLILLTLSSLFAVFLGLLLYSTGDYGGDVLSMHLWTGIGVAVGSLWLLISQLQFLNSPTPSNISFYWVVLLLTNGILVFASHQGGSLTHGTDYITEYLPSLNPAPLKPESEMLVYADIIVPMLDAKCYSCHNEHKTKGELLLTTMADMTSGGKSGEAGIVPERPEESEVWERVALPVTHDDHMPPDGKPSLTTQEKDLLYWWIETGASPTLAYQDALADSAIADHLLEYNTTLRRAHQQKWEADQQLAKLVNQVSSENASYQLIEDPDNATALHLKMQFPPASFTDESLVALRPLSEKFTEVSLVSSEITDDGLYHIGQMEQLQTLSLQRTGIDGSGLVFLTELPQLEVLDLSHCPLTDANLLYITRMPALKELYLYETPISPQTVEMLSTHLPQLSINLTRSPKY
ncbi:MAG: c-type cytochrome domain-containing protein [Bacteroidota bacterium]